MPSSRVISVTTHMIHRIDFHRQAKVILANTEGKVFQNMNLNDVEMYKTLYNQI